MVCVAVAAFGPSTPLRAFAAGVDGPGGGGTAYRHMELADFKEYKGDIPGSRIELSGWLVGVTGDAILFTDPDDRTGIVIDLSRLGPDDRRRVRDCTRACEATVQGVAAKVQRRNGLRAARIYFR